jgi:hypothetical protein
LDFNKGESADTTAIEASNDADTTSSNNDLFFMILYFIAVFKIDMDG